ncbi:MAG: efflux RND transporter permease subunit [Nitrospiria bacterium]
MSFGSKLIENVIRKRSVIIILSAFLLGLGIYSFRQLPIEPYPNIAPLNVQVITQWPGRSTLEIERQLTIPIESSLASVPNVQSFRSVSLFGLSVVTIQFKEGTDSFHARHDVQLYLANANLQNGITPNLSPDSDALGEILRYRLEGKGVDLITLKSYADWEVYKNLKHVQGVADINNFGGLIKQYQVLPKPEKMQYYGISINQLVTALTNANANVGGDIIHSGEQQYVVRGVGLLQSLEDIRNVVVAVNQGVAVKIGDICEVQIGNAPRLGVVQFNQEPDIVQGIVLLRRGGNASEVLDRVRDKIKELNSGLLPPGIKLVPFYDRQVLLDLTTRTVSHTLFFGIMLVLAVLFLFLGNIWASLVVAAVIPLGLCVSFIVMNLSHIPANLISLGAIDFGVIVDSAVIILENIMRRLETSRLSTSDETIVDATTEVLRAMIFSTGIIIVTYSTLFFIGGVEGKIFEPMGSTTGVALVASIVLSITFLPAMMSFLFKGNLRPYSPQFIGKVLNYYKPLLESLIKKPLLVFGSALLIFSIALIGVYKLGTDYLPTLEENNLWVRLTLPNTVDLSYSASFASQIRKYFASQPEVETVAVQIGRPDDGTDSTGVFNQEYATYFKAPDQWPAGETRKDVVERFQKYLEKIPGIEYNFSQYIQDNVAEALSGVKGENSVKLIGNDLNILNEKSKQIKQILEKIPGIVDVGIFQELGQPTLNVNVKREQCARFGLNVSDVENVVLNGIGGNTVSSILEGERTFDLAIRFPESKRDTLEKINALYVDTPDGQRIPLKMVADVELTDGPFFIYRETGKRYIPIKFGVRDRDLGSAVAEAKKAIGEQIKLPFGFVISWAGQFNQMREAQIKLAIIIPLTLLTIFLLLYTAFGHAGNAAIVILNVPFAAIGGIAALYLADETLSISAGIGFLSLFGIAIQDGVILISYISKMMESGNNLAYSVINGAALRFRPVLMTALLAGLGRLPAALSHAIGSQAQRPLALVIVGGMVSTTLLTLLVMPVVFSWVHRKSEPIQRVSTN